MLNKLGRRMNEHSEKFNKELENIKNQTEQNKQKRMKWIEDSLRDLGDNIKRTNIRIIGVPEEEERKGLRKYLKRL